MLTMSMNKEVADALNQLLGELASELDLHYEDEDFFALAPTMEKMKAAADLLTEDDYEVTPVYLHILKRFNRHRQ